MSSRKTSIKSPQTPQQSQPPSGPSEINPEEIIFDEKDELGRGKFGVVYKGVCRSTDVAVKVPVRQDLSERDLEKFRREVNIMSRINHPNVCLFMGACTRPGHIRIVCEKLKCTVESMMKNESCLLSQRMKWARDAACGVAWLHSLSPPLIHRDFKTANMLADEHDLIKVCDFGLSQFQPAERGLRDSSPKGTPLYMAPEVMMCKDITPKVDVYAFGICLWELLRRCEAFPHHNNLKVFAKAICHSKERPIIPEGCPESLSRLMQQCWDHDPAKRPTFAEIITRIDVIIKECEAIEARMWVERLVPDRNACTLWLRYFMGKSEVPWSEFVRPCLEALRLPMPDNPDILSQNTQHLFALKAVLCEGTVDESIVTLDRWGRTAGWFGPLEIPFQQNGFLERVMAVLNQQCFYGSISTPNAESLLVAHVPGTYLFRFSNGQRNHFVLSKVNRDREVEHFLVPYVPGRGFRWTDGLYYESLSMIEATQATNMYLRYPMQCDKYLWIFDTNTAGVRAGYQNPYKNQAVLSPVDEQMGDK